MVAILPSSPDYTEISELQQKLCWLKNPFLVREFYETDEQGCVQPAMTTNAELDNLIDIIVCRLEFLLDMVEFRAYGWDSEILIKIFGTLP